MLPNDGTENLNYYFAKNVYVFKDSKLEKYEDEKINLYGAAFTEFYQNESQLEDFVLPESNKLNILLLHCDLNGSKDKEGLSYNPILETKIKNLENSIYPKAVDYTQMSSDYINASYQNSMNIM